MSQRIDIAALSQFCADVIPRGTWRVPYTAIPYEKYRVENGRNTDTAFMIGDAYLPLYPSREFFFFFYLKHVYTRNQP